MSGFGEISASNRDIKKLLGNPKITFILGRIIYSYVCGYLKVVFM